MNKSLKKLSFSHKWQLMPAVFTFIVLSARLLTPIIPTALAVDRTPIDYNNLLAQAEIGPMYLRDLVDPIEKNLYLENDVFIQPVAEDNRCRVEICPVAPVPQPVAKRPVNVKDAAGRITVTAYSSTVDQTDSTPFITANGTYVADGIVACNFLPFGTKVKFPEYFGDKVFTVQDRMAVYNGHKIDVWMETRTDAMQFGVRHLAYEIVK